MDAWKHRRRLVYASLIFSAGLTVLCIGLVAIGKMPEALAGTVITTALLHGFGVLGAYIWGAAWDDKNKRYVGGPAE